MLDQHEHQQATHDFDGIVENRRNAPPLYFAILFYGLIIWGVIFSAYYLLSGWSSEAEFQHKMTQHQQAQQPTTGSSAAAPAAAAPATLDAAALYARSCAMCHGADGTGGIGPDLSAASYAYGKAPAAVTESIAAGRSGGMPGFAGQLSQAEIQALVDYLLAL